jgi:hypothetical protein
MTMSPEPVDDGRIAVGRNTYYHGRPFLPYGPDARIEIGAFCSIAHEVRILGGGEHAFELPSTYPFRTVLSRAGEGEWDIFAKGATRLGNDVWVGRGAMILSGSQIGHGAVIGAGNPGTVIGSRFDEPTIERMLAVRWWDWPDQLIEEMEPFFYSAVDVFLDEAERLNAAIAAAAGARASVAATAS